MIDKKPYRVTNEQMDAEIICAHSKGCSGCQREHEDCSQITETNIAAFLDLKDARELIDKQKAIIKKMRRMLESDRSTMEIYEAQITGERFNSPSLNELLEESKEYI